MPVPGHGATALLVGIGACGLACTSPSSSLPQVDAGEAGVPEAVDVPGDAEAEAPEAPPEDDAAVPVDEPGEEDAGEADTGPSLCESAAAAVVEPIGLLAAGRYSPAVAVLPEGRVLIAGGYDFARGIQRSVELFDPASDALVETGSLRLGRNFAAVAVRADGAAVVFGGFNPGSGSVATSEVFDAAAGTWSLAGDSMEVGREAHTATPLPDGRILVAGGLQAIGFEFHAEAELYDPASDAFAATGAPMNARRAFHAAVLLASGSSVLLIGGDSGGGELATAERYEVERDEFWNAEGPLPHAAKAPAVVLLRDGRVLVAGGANARDGTLADASAYDPATDRFAPLEPMAVRRMAHTLTLLSDGRALAAGGWSDSTAPSASADALEVFDPATGRWETLPVRLARARHDHAAVLLPDCRVLVVGGQSVVGGGAPAAPREAEAITVPAAR
jgi:hypothetical protein